MILRRCVTINLLTGHRTIEYLIKELNAMIARVFVYSRMWECGKCWYRATEKPNRTVNRNLGSKPIETDRKRKIPHRNNTVWNIRSRDYSFPGTFVPMMELSFSRLFIPWTIHSLHYVSNIGPLFAFTNIVYA